MNAVGLIALGKQGIFARPSLRSGVIRRWLHELHPSPPHMTDSLRASLARLEHLPTARGVLVVISDLHEPEGCAILERLAYEHETIVLQLHDPSERGDLAGYVRATEAETGRPFLGRRGRLWIDPEQVGERIRRAPVDSCLIDIGKPVVPVVTGFLRRRHRTRGK
jgi:hypothetical protein